MRPLKEYHHFREELIDPNDRVSRCERYLVDLLLQSDLDNSKRESSICWELKHQASTAQFARLLALKRGLPVDICAIGLLLHDVNSVVHGKYKDHARLGTPIAMQILHEIGGFSDEELDQISRIIYNHSDKHIWTDDPLQEIGKDVDVLDCFLYEGAFDYYLGHKPLPIFKEYLKRAKKVWKELKLPLDARFDLLDGYKSSWFQNIQTMPLRLVRDVLAVLLELSEFKKNLGVYPPPFSIVVESEEGKFYADQKKWTNYVERIATESKGLIPDKTSKVFGSVLREFLKKEPDIKMINQPQFLVKSGIVTKENFEKATRILLRTQDTLDLKSYALLFWPLLDTYELLYDEKMGNRLQEVGVQR